MQPKITCSESAYQHIQKMMAQQHGIGLRLSIKKTGCSGYSYAPTIVSSVNDKDMLIKLDNGIDVYIDVSWLHLLNEVHIDFVEEKKTNITQKKLLFTNPNESGRCGCGESFHITSD